KPHDVAWKKHGNDRATPTTLCAFDSSPTSIITPSSKLKKSTMLPQSQLTSFSQKGSGKLSIPFFIADLQLFFLLLHLHPLWQTNLHLSSLRKSPNSTFLYRQQLTPHHHTLNHLLYHLNLPPSALPKLIKSPESSIRHR